MYCALTRAVGYAGEVLEFFFKVARELLQTPYPLGFNDNIYHEGNLSKMPDFDVFSLLEFRKRIDRSHGIKKNENCKRKSRVQKLVVLLEISWFLIQSRLTALLTSLIARR